MQIGNSRNTVRTTKIQAKKPSRASGESEMESEGEMILLRFKAGWRAKIVVELRFD